jgi:hypothetical protein
MKSGRGAVMEATGPWQVDFWDRVQGQVRYCLRRPVPERLSGYEILTSKEQIVVFYTKAKAEIEAWKLNLQTMRSRRSSLNLDADEDEVNEMIEDVA